MVFAQLAKRAVKTAFGAVGVSITRTNAANGASSHKFSPNAHDQFNWLKNAGIRTVFDIGANIGQFAGHINSILPSATIYSFEPLRDCYEQLIFNAAEIPSFSAFPYALGDENKTVEFHHNEFSPSSSILPMGTLHRQNFPFTEKTIRETIDVKRLDDVALNLHVLDNILIKIDVQGFEGSVIRGGANTIQQAKILIVETSFEPLYENQSLFDDIYSTLRNMGFTFHGTVGQLLSPLDGRILQADSLFLR